MRCSLLTLSTYLDRELAPEKAAEIDAHLVACARCQTGLGYLREESQRIRTLTRVTVSEESAHALLSAIGLIEEDEPLPGERQWHASAAPEQGPHAWMPDGGGRGLPWTPRSPSMHPHVATRSTAVHPPPPPPPAPGDAAPSTDDPYTMTMHFDASRGSVTTDVDEEPSLPLESWVDDDVVAGAPPLQAQEEAHEVEVAGTAQQVVTPPTIHIPSVPPQPPAHPPVAHPPSQPAPRSPISSIAARMRDALAVRMALLHESKLDPDVQIVSGTGAPARRRHAAGPPTPTLDETEIAHAEFPRPVPDTAEAMGTAHAPPAPVEIPDDSDEFDVPQSWVTGIAAEHPAVIEDDTVIDDEPVVTRAAPDQETVRATASDTAQAPSQPLRPGRHMRSVRGDSRGMPAWLSLQPLRTAMNGIARSRGPAVGVAGRDNRLWVFGAVLLVLLAVGVLTGKSTTPVSPAGTATTQPPAVPRATAPLPTAAGVTPATPLPSTAPTPRATPAPTPPPAAALPQLLSPQTLGSGAQQFSLQDLRYGEHPGDFRIVFDLSNATGAGGAPKVTVGLDAAGTALYVEFSSVSASGQPQSPISKSPISAATLVLPAPPGMTVYKFTLAKKVTVSAFYLGGPTRLVIDLR